MLRDVPVSGGGHGFSGLCWALRCPIPPVPTLRRRRWSGRDLPPPRQPGNGRRPAGSRGFHGARATGSAGACTAQVLEYRRSQCFWGPRGADGNGTANLSTVAAKWGGPPLPPRFSGAWRRRGIADPPGATLGARGCHHTMSPVWGFHKIPTRGRRCRAKPARRHISGRSGACVNGACLQTTCCVCAGRGGTGERAAPREVRPACCGVPSSWWNPAGGSSNHPFPVLAPPKAAGRSVGGAGVGPGSGSLRAAWAGTPTPPSPPVVSPPPHAACGISPAASPHPAPNGPRSPPCLSCPLLGRMAVPRLRRPRPSPHRFRPTTLHQGVTAPSSLSLAAMATAANTNSEVFTFGAGDDTADVRLVNPRGRWSWLGRSSSAGL